MKDKLRLIIVIILFALSIILLCYSGIKKRNKAKQIELEMNRLEFEKEYILYSLEDSERQVQ